MRRRQHEAHSTIFALLAAALPLSACSSLGGGDYGFSDYSLVRVQRVNVGDGSMTVVAAAAVEPPPPDPVRRHPRGRGLDARTGRYLDGISFVTGLKSGKT